MTTGNSSVADQNSAYSQLGNAYFACYPLQGGS
jgi:hypothetical protein